MHSIHWLSNVHCACACALRVRVCYVCVCVCVCLWVWHRYVMKTETFLGLRTMLPFEELITDGRVFEWTPELGGGVFFLSHQWTSFRHPDPMGEQLEVAQGFLSKVADGKIRSLFATSEEWLAFKYKEAQRFLNFGEVRK